MHPRRGLRSALTSGTQGTHPNPQLFQTSCSGVAPQHPLLLQNLYLKPPLPALSHVGAACPSPDVHHHVARCRDAPLHWRSTCHGSDVFLAWAALSLAVAAKYVRACSSRTPQTLIQLEAAHLRISHSWWYHECERGMEVEPCLHMLQCSSMDPQLKCCCSSCCAWPWYQYLSFWSGCCHTGGLQTRSPPTAGCPRRGHSLYIHVLGKEWLCAQCWHKPQCSSKALQSTHDADCAALSQRLSVGADRRPALHVRYQLVPS